MERNFSNESLPSINSMNMNMNMGGINTINNSFQNVKNNRNYDLVIINWFIII